MTQYHVYDIASMEYATYTDRNLFILAESCFKNKYCIQVTPTKLLQILMMQKYHEKTLKAGYEGSIYRTPSGKYKGTRSWDLMKFKDFHDAEATIINYEVGKGKA